MRFISTFSLSILVVVVFGQLEECDIGAAEKCAIQLQSQYDEAYMEYEAQEVHSNSQTLSDLCMSVLRGSKTTKCFDGNIKGCADKETKYIKTQYEETQRDIMQFCNNSMCENFESLKDCKESIYELGMKNGQVERFCRTFNESFSCANPILEEECLFNIGFYNSLVGRMSIGFYGRACTSGCGNLDPILKAINECWSHTYSKLDDCSRHSNFKTCLLEKTDICPEIGKLLPPHIKYDYLEIACTTTSTTTTLPTTTTTTLPTTTTTTLPTTLPTTTTTTLPTTTTTMTTELPETTTVTTKLPETSTTIRLPDTTITTTTFQSPTPQKFTTYLTSNNTLSFTTSASTSMVNMEKELSIVDHIKACIPVSLNNSSSWNTTKLDYSKCMSIQLAIVCINSNIGSQKETNNFLPRHIHSFLKHGRYKECEQIINGFSSYFRRVEVACTPHIDTGCSGHGYGLLDCSSGASLTKTIGPILTVILILLR